MKKTFITLFMIAVVVLEGNATAADETVVLTHDQDIYWKGEVVYTARKGDELHILKVKPCRTDPKKECWIVNHSEKGKGAVRREWVESSVKGRL